MKSKTSSPIKTRAEKSLITEAKRVAVMPDSAIDYSDIPPIDFEKWKSGKVVRGSNFFRPVKSLISLRIDCDVLDFFRESGSGYQSRINEALRAEMNRQRRPSR